MENEHFALVNVMYGQMNFFCVSTGVMQCLLINGVEHIFNEDVKCKEITNNCSEYWNNFIASARAQLACGLVDVIN